MLPKGESIQEKASRWQEDNNNDNISIARMRWNRMIQIEDYILRSFPKKSVHDFGDELCLISRLVELTMFQLAKTIDEYDNEQGCDDDFLARRIRVICCAHARKIVQARRIHKTLKQIRTGSAKLTRKCPDAAGAA
uniref:Uncharacterized protein n=1 Tax=Leptocylindrus danicus TaxID=163516 RepID=A0A7S2PQ01_9STRA|mmetsp:Transcript_8344/g.12413  ORF Transcript_8344/g.12413 Transcript_8344/m.12413 type:complete len:136 (+) Transcript_8344:1-408(+)